MIRREYDIINPNHSLMGLSPLIFDTGDNKSKQSGDSIYKS